MADPTLAIFERRADRPPNDVAHLVPTLAAGFAKMKQLTRRRAGGGAHRHGGHTEVPFAARGEAPWRELNCSSSGFSPVEAIAAATGTARRSCIAKIDRHAACRAPGGSGCREVTARDISAVRQPQRVMIGGRIDIARYHC
jgi:hypothetical protein